MIVITNNASDGQTIYGVNIPNLTHTDPGPTWQLAPGASYSLDESSEVGNGFYLYHVSPGDYHNNPQPAFWKGWLRGNDAAVVIPATGQVMVTSNGITRVVQSNTGGVLSAQISYGTFTCFVGNAAAAGQKLVFDVPGDTPYLTFRLQAVPGQQIYPLAGVFADGPGGIAIRNATKTDQIRAQANSTGTVTSIFVIAPAAGTWTVWIQGGQRGDYVVIAAIASNISSMHDSTHGAIEGATPISIDVLGKLLPAGVAGALQDRLDPGACFACMVEWYLVLGVVEGASLDDRSWDADSWLVTTLQYRFWIDPAVSVRILIKFAGAFQTPQQWPDIWCRQLDMCMDARQADLDAFKRQYPGDTQIQQLTLAQLTAYAKGKDPSGASATTLPGSHPRRGTTTDCVFAVGGVLVDVFCLVTGFRALRDKINPAAVESVGAAIEAATPGSLSRIEEIVKILENTNYPSLKEQLIAQGGAIYEIVTIIKNGMALEAIWKVVVSSLTWWDMVLYGMLGMAELAAAFLTDGAAYAALLAVELITAGFFFSDCVKVVQECFGSGGAPVPAPPATPGS